MPEIVGKLIPSNNRKTTILDSMYIKGGYSSLDSISYFESMSNLDRGIGSKFYIRDLNSTYTYIGGPWSELIMDFPNLLSIDRATIISNFFLVSETPKVVEDSLELRSNFTTNSSKFRIGSFKSGSIVCWGLSMNTPEEFTMVGYGKLKSFTNSNYRNIAYIEKDTIVGEPPKKGDIIYRIGNTGNSNLDLIANSVLVAYPKTKKSKIVLAKFRNTSLDNLFKDCISKIEIDLPSADPLYIEGIKLKGEFINSEGVNIEDNIAKAQLTANRAESNTDDLFQRYQDLEGKVNGIDTNTENISELRSAVATNTSTIATVKTTADEAHSKANDAYNEAISALDSAMQNTGSIESLTEEVYRASDTATEAYDMGVALTPKVTALETKSTELTTAVAAAAADATEAKTASASLNTRVGTVESTVSELGTTIEDISETANNADTKSTQNSTLITELAQQVTTATETANAASTLANNTSNIIPTIQESVSNALNNSQIALDALGGKKIVLILESEYSQLVTKDPDTLYFCMPDSGGSPYSLEV